MSNAYEFPVSVYHAPVLDMDAGLRARGTAPGDSISSSGLEKLREALALPLEMTRRLALPVMLLATLLGAIFLYNDAVLQLPQASRAIHNAVLTASDLIVPLSWLYLHLTNRRFGAGYAFAQLLAALAIVAAVALANPGDIDDWTSINPAVSLRGVLAFAAAFGLSSFTGIAIFDATRGPSWWTAPLSASMTAALVFTLVYYPITFAGTADMHWTDCLMVHFGLFFAEGMALLLPYYLLRSAMRPIGGLNGY